jgi:hypothetical protein
LETVSTVFAYSVRPSAPVRTPPLAEIVALPAAGGADDAGGVLAGADEVPLPALLLLLQAVTRARTATPTVRRIRLDIGITSVLKSLLHTLP